MKENKTLVIAMSFAALIIMSVAYAAFANVITITANSTAANAGSVTTSITCPENAATAGVSGSNMKPIATPGGSGNVFTIQATLRQPNDIITCFVTWKNETPFTVKTVSGITGCSDVTGTTASPVAITLSDKPTAGKTLSVNSSMTMAVRFSYYDTGQANQGSSYGKNASITCSIVWAQA